MLQTAARGAFAVAMAPADFVVTPPAAFADTELTVAKAPAAADNMMPSIGMFTKACRFDPHGVATLTRSFVDLNLVAAPSDMATLYTDAPQPN